MDKNGFKYVATTPRSLTDAIRTFCSGLSAEEPVFLDVQPASFAQLGMCYDNASQAVEIMGGQVIYGWLIWELDGIYATAEHHAVVELNGNFVDVSPPVAGERRVLFIADRVSKFDSSRPANKYVALVANKLIEDYVEIVRRNSELELLGKAYGYEHSNNDRLATELLDQYFSRQQNVGHKKNERMKKKAERQRKKSARRKH